MQRLNACSERPLLKVMPPKRAQVSFVRLFTCSQCLVQIVDNSERDVGAPSKRGRRNDAAEVTRAFYLGKNVLHQQSATQSTELAYREPGGSGGATTAEVCHLSLSHERSSLQYEVVQLVNNDGAEREDLVSMFLLYPIIARLHSQQANERKREKRRDDAQSENRRMQEVRTAFSRRR